MLMRKYCILRRPRRRIVPHDWLGVVHPALAPLIHRALQQTPVPVLWSAPHAQLTVIVRIGGENLVLASWRNGLGVTEHRVLPRPRLMICVLRCDG